jgi:hypothetical protein
LGQKYLTKQNNIKNINIIVGYDIAIKLNIFGSSIAARPNTLES